MTFGRFRTLPPLIVGAALLASCAASGPFPSLAPRAVERAGTDGTTPVPPCLSAGQVAPRPAETPIAVAEPADPTLPARLAAFRAKAETGDRAFATAIDAAAKAASSAGAAGSESWVLAQQAVSRAESARAPTLDALSDLSALTIETAQRRANHEDAQALQDALHAVQEIADRQAARINGVGASLKAP